MKKNIKTTSAVAIFSVFVFLLCFAVTFFTPDFTSPGSDADMDVFLLSRLALQFTAFLIPAILFIKIANVRTLHLSRYGTSVKYGILLCVPVCLILISASAIYLPIYSDMTNTYSGGVYGIYDMLKIILIYCLIPAFCEELVFRGLIMSALRPYGLVYSLLFSSILFSSVHFSHRGFLLYLIGGVILGLCTEVSGSFIFSAICHLFYNIYTVFFASDVQNSVYSYSPTFYNVTFICLFLISLIFAFYICEHIFFASAIKRPQNKNITHPPIRSQIGYILTSPAVILSTAVCMIYSISISY